MSSWAPTPLTAAGNEPSIDRAVSSGLDGQKATDAVFESAASPASEQAEYRLHTIKSLLVATLER
ncbi:MULTISPECIES: hypothetical protein [unclassified Streptomyces]|uniref:hypothetical protein n=1 Tax=Streptomyces sp. CNQ-509 TaxID=444103 RepID=UPI00119A7181